MIFPKTIITTILALMIIVTGTAVALDVPHDKYVIGDETIAIDCFSCHVVHNYLGPSLTGYDAIVNLCKSCHSDVGPGPVVDTHRDQPCTICHNPHTQDQNITHGSTYGKFIRTQVETPNSGVKNVEFTAPTGDNSFADGDTTYDGICEVCHTPPTKYHTNNGDVEGAHHDGEYCVGCHGHVDGFSFGMGGGAHVTHVTKNYGPRSLCEDCHGNDLPLLDGGNDLAGTDVCNECHSPDGVALAKGYWDSFGSSEGIEDSWAVEEGEASYCGSCHDDDAAEIYGVEAPDISLFWTAGHGRTGANVACGDCHDILTNHIDGNARTYGFNSAYYGPNQSGDAYASGYRLKYVNGEVPLMIPANYSITFSYNAGLMRDTAFRLCFECHDSSNVFDNTPGDGLDTNFKASQPNPPRNYSYAWGSGADTNEHVSHIMNYVGPFADSDWDTGTDGPGGSNGNDTTTGCFACHNVHGAAGAAGSTNEAMIRDGSLAGRTSYGFSYVIEDTGSGGYPWVTSTGATQAASVGAIFRNNTNSMCGATCHGYTTQTDPSYDASGSSWGTYLEYYRPWQNY